MGINILRIQNCTGYLSFRGAGCHPTHNQGDTGKGNTMMFHGCRSGSGDVKSMVMDGFNAGGDRRLSCKAGDSDSGYVIADEEGTCHIFLCIVSTHDVKFEGTVGPGYAMRDVGPHCAVPMWMITYK